MMNMSVSDRPPAYVKKEAAYGAVAVKAGLKFP